MKISIIGTGYVGLTLALALSRKDHMINCFDINNNLIRNLRKGITDIKEPLISQYINEGIEKGKLFFYTNVDKVRYSKVVFITVGSNIVNGSGDLYKERILDIFAKCVEDKVKFVILRSTISVGFADILNETYGSEMDIIYAPERTIEGNAIRELFNIPQIIACKNRNAKEISKEIFRDFKVRLLFTENYQEAELAKLICNTYRDYNFAFSNQISMLCKSLSLDLSRVDKLASQNYDRFPKLKPGPVSGPCLSKDVHILSDSFESKDQCEFLVHARNMNNKVLKIAIDDIKKISEKFKVKNILIMGLGFKSNPPVGDTRDSHSLLLSEYLENNGFCLYFYDPIVDSQGKEYIKDRNIEDNLDIEIDLIVFPIIPFWYGKENFIMDKFINSKRYWLYRPNELYKKGEDFIFGEYEKLNHL
tara:strand:- start:8007 stop:9263 length:1257 start_codon:yes stop_codon:yes gene_type:complete